MPKNKINLKKELKKLGLIDYEFNNKRPAIKKQRELEKKHGMIPPIITIGQKRRSKKKFVLFEPKEFEKIK